MHFSGKGNATRRSALLACVLALFMTAACSSGEKNAVGYAQSASSVHAAASKKAARQTQPATAVPVYQPAPYSSPSPVVSAEPLTVDGGAGTRTAMAGPDALSSLLGNGKIQVALLLPMSGKHAALGQAMLNAAQLAVFDIAPSNFELMPRDTSGTPEGAAQAARDAIASGARLLIGPLFAQDVTAVKPVVQSSNVNMLSLSTDVSLAEPGVYVMGFAPAPQVERVIAYAASQGAHRFAAIIPPGAYGKLVQKAFEEAVQSHGGMVVGLDTPAHVAAMASKKDQIDALLIPLGGNELKQTAAQLAAAGFDRTKTHMLGTGLWDEPGLGSRSEILVGGWYAAAEPDVREAFVKNYKKTYGQEPPRLATLTYDATALAAVLATREGGRFDRSALTNPSGFAGLDGIFRLTFQGLAERGLAINEITSTGSKIVDPSPSTFTGYNPRN